MHGDNELVLQHEGLEVIFSYVKQQYEGSDKVKLRNIFTGFMETSLGSYQKHISGSMMTTIDAAAELLTQMGVEFGESDWNSYKTNIVQILKRDGDAGSASQPSQPKRLRSSLSIRSTLGSELHDGEEQQHTQTLDSEIFDVDDFEDTQQPQQPQHETETILAIRKKNKKMQTILEKQSLVIRTLQKEKKLLQQKVRRMKDQAEKTKENHEIAMNKVRDDLNSNFHASRISTKPKSWLTPQGTVAIALRRNIGNVACSLLGHIILQDIAGCTVSRCEVKSGAALAAHSQAFYQYMLHAFKSGDSDTDNDDKFQVAIHCFREDGTNSGIWRKSKLAAMETESFFATNASSLEKAMESGHHLRRLADVQRISDGSGLGTVALYFKQMKSIGLPTWFDLYLVR